MAHTWTTTARLEPHHDEVDAAGWAATTDRPWVERGENLSKQVLLLVALRFIAWRQTQTVFVFLSSSSSTAAAVRFLFAPACPHLCADVFPCQRRTTTTVLYVWKWRVCLEKRVCGKTLTKTGVGCEHPPLGKGPWSARPCGVARNGKCSIICCQFLTAPINLPGRA